MKRIVITDETYGRLRYIRDVLGVSDYSEAIDKLIEFYVDNSSRV